MANEVTESTLRQNAFKSLWTIIDQYKVTGTKIYPSFPTTNPTFPCYIIKPFDVSVNDETLGHRMTYSLSVEIELWCKGESLKAKIDEMKDNITTTIVTYVTTLEAQNLTLDDDWSDDTNVETVSINGEKYHTGAVMLKFKLSTK
jgi:hypothetical protein